MSEHELQLTHICKAYPSPTGSTTVLRDIDLTVAHGETVAIVGPSGSGKSTLLQIIGSLDAPSSGAVRLGETNVAALTGKALTIFRATTVGFVFQDHHLLPQLTALENVLLPTIPAGRKGKRDEAKHLLEAVGVTHREHAFPAQMSGGERQRVAVARALINQPRLLLCDEPTGNLDRAAGDSVVGLLLNLARERDTIVLMVTHNLAHAARFDRCFTIDAGQLVPFDPAVVGSEQ